jgi:hypothetical protein
MSIHRQALHKALPFIVLVPMAVVQNGSLISLAIVVLTLLIVKASRGPTLAFRGERLAAQLALGIGAGAAVWLVSHLLMDPLLERVFGRIDLDSLANVRGNFGNFLFLLALGLVYGGVFEELIGRGFVIGWGVALFGERAAIPLLLISTIVFGMAHRYQDTSGMISAGLSGLAFGVVYLIAGRKLMPAMLAHAVADAIGVTSLYLGHSA